MLLSSHPFPTLVNSMIRPVEVAYHELGANNLHAFNKSVAKVKFNLKILTKALFSDLHWRNF